MSSVEDRGHPSLIEDGGREAMDEHPITDWMRLGGVVRRERRAQGLTQAKLAERAKVARSWLARVEAGHRSAELEPLLRLLDALSLSLFVRPHRPVAEDETMAVHLAVLEAAAQNRMERWQRPFNYPDGTS